MDVLTTVVFSDADNTLWDTDKVFADAQLKLLASLETRLGVSAKTEDRLSYLRNIDQGIAEHHHRRLRYPPRLLAKALAMALTGTSAKNAARRAWSAPLSDQVISDEEALHFESIMLAALQNLPPLRLGVMSGLAGLRNMGSIIFIITEGARDRVMRTLIAHGLESGIDRVIDGPKSPRLYRRALSLVRGVPRAFMVGDQLDRDIQPAKEAGLVTVYFPGGFQPYWEPKVRSVQPDFRIDRFDQLTQIVANVASRNAK